MPFALEFFSPQIDIHFSLLCLYISAYSFNLNSQITKMCLILGIVSAAALSNFFSRIIIIDPLMNRI